MIRHLPAQGYVQESYKNVLYSFNKKRRYSNGRKR
nr:MAG TPA: hypothetical protein [Caudoviricetes sp.]